MAIITSRKNDEGRMINLLNIIDDISIGKPFWAARRYFFTVGNGQY
jgi:hypothetical protein